MNCRQRRTLEAIFARPTLATVVWADVESLLRAIGASISQGKGLRVRVEFNGERAVFHEPHPEKEAAKGAVEAVRDFLAVAGVTP